MKRSNYLIVSLFLVFLLTTSGMLFGQRVVDLIKMWGDMRIRGADVYDRSGYAIDYGDINGDGYMDIIIGAPWADPEGRSKAGETYVIFASSNLPSTIDLSQVPADITVYGEYGEDWSGCAVASGDINGDGYDDIIIGARYAYNDHGRVYVIFGGSLSSPPYTIDLRIQSADITICGPGYRDFVGWAVSTGDVNNDGYDDIITPYNFNTYVIFGSSSLPSSIDLWESGDIKILNSYGEALAKGDVNNDGYDDIIIGAEVASPGGKVYAGETYVIFGSSFPSPPYTIDLSTVSADITVYGDNEWDRLGHAVTSGDINGDAYDDIIIGAHKADAPGGTDAGETYVIFGSSTPPSTIDLSTTSADITVCGAAAADWSGWALASGDINGDEYDDLIIGAPWADCGLRRGLAGETYVIFGSNFPLPTYTIDLSSQLADLTIYGNSNGDYLGYDVACGDINNDGYGDIISSAYRAFRPERPGAGETYILSGGGAMITAHGVGGEGWIREFSQMERAWLKFRAFETETGEVQLAVGDMDGDGLDEIAAGHGEGGSSLVKLFEVDGTFIRSFLAFNATQNPGGEVHLAVGNFDADTSDNEIAVATGYNGGNRVRLFETDGTFISQFAAFGISGNANGEVHIAAADIDGDGIDEIICGHGEGGSSWVKLFEVDGSLIRSFRAFGAVNANGEVHLAMGNFDADPSDIEIAVAHGEGGKSWVKLFETDGSIIGGFKAFGLVNAQGEVHLAAAEVKKGDGIWEVICGHGEGGSSMVKVFTADGTVIRSFKAFGSANSQGEVHLAKSNY